MSIKLVVVKSGEQIITRVEEMLFEDRLVGYFFNKPCLIKTSDPIIDKKTKNTSFDIKLSPWISLGKGDRFSVPLDWVVTFVDPIENLRSMYQSDILKTKEDIREQSIVIDDSCEECK